MPIWLQKMKLKRAHLRRPVLQTIWNGLTKPKTSMCRYMLRSRGKSDRCRMCRVSCRQCGSPNLPGQKPISLMKHLNTLENCRRINIWKNF